MDAMCRRFVALFVVLLVPAGYVAAAQSKGKAPIFIAPGFDYSALEQVTILPLIDARIDKKTKLNSEKLCDEAFKNLKKKRYEVQKGPGGDTPADLREDDLKDATPELIDRLGPEGARWVLVVVLGDLESRITFGNVANAAVTSFLFDTQERRLVWMDKGVGQSGSGGLAGMMFKGMDKGIALSSALKASLASIPNRPKPKK